MLLCPCSMDEFAERVIAMSRKVSISLLCSLLSALGGCEKSATTKPASDSQSRSSAGSPNVSQSVPITAKRKPDQPTFDACGLITKEEIEAIQGSPITDMKSSARTDGPFRVSQCFYTAAEFSKSVSVAVTQPDPNNPGKRTPREFWKETFGRYSGQEKERDDAGNIPAPEHRRPEVEREASVPPKRIPAIGDEAYWTVGPGGALYVLKNDAFIRISVGGADDEETKIEKSKTLAQKALARW